MLCCFSLVHVSRYQHAFHIFFDPARLHVAVVVVVAFALVSCLLTFADFSFGYFVGFYFYTMVLGHLWLNWKRDHPGVIDNPSPVDGCSPPVSALSPANARPSTSFFDPPPGL